MGNRLEFWLACASRARKGTGAFANDWQWIFGNPLQSTLASLASVGLGAFAPTLLARLGGAQMTTGSAGLDSFIGAFVAFLITWVVAILWKIWVTAPEMYFEQKKRADTYEEDSKPKINVIATSDVYPKDAQKGIRTVRIEVTNISKSTLKNCRVREAKFINRFGQESAMRRHFRRNEETHADIASHTYSQTFDLQGYGSTEIVDIAQLDETKDDSRVSMLYATSPTAPALSEIIRDCFPHRLTISVTADNLPVGVVQSYDLKISNGVLQIEPA